MAPTNKIHAKKIIIPVNPLEYHQGPKRKGGRGSTLPSKSREMVVNITKALMEENQAAQARAHGDESRRHDRGLKTRVRTEVCERLEISKTTYHNIMKEAKEAKESRTKLVTPGKHRKRSNTMETVFEGFQRAELRKRIMRMYHDHEFPTIDKLCNYAIKELHYTGHRTSLHRLLKNSMGFRYKRISGRKILLERNDIQVQRHKFLQAWRQYTEEGRNFVYLDEAWLWEHHAPQTKDGKGVKVRSGKGKRLIVIHAGGKQGFIKDCVLLVTPKTSYVHYEKDLSPEMFTEWFRGTLLPNISPRSVIVMDNSPYHSTRSDPLPTSVSSKASMISWLIRHGITYASYPLLKCELYDLVMRYKPASIKYVVDELAEAAGHAVLRTPPFHSEFNPMELIWTAVKEEVAKRNTTHKIEDVSELTKEVIGEIGAEKWAESIGKVGEICQHHYKNAVITEMHIEEMIANTSGSFTDSETSSDDSEED